MLCEETYVTDAPRKDLGNGNRMKGDIIAIYTYWEDMTLRGT